MQLAIAALLLHVSHVAGQVNIDVPIGLLLRRGDFPEASGSNAIDTTSLSAQALAAAVDSVNTKQSECLAVLRGRVRCSSILRFSMHL